MADKPPQPLLDAEVNLDIVLGRATVPLRVLMDWTEGSLLELDSQDYGRIERERAGRRKLPGIAPNPYRVCLAEIRANGKQFATGEVCTVGNNLGVRVEELTD